MADSTPFESFPVLGSALDPASAPAGDVSFYVGALLGRPAATPPGPGVPRKRAARHHRTIFLSDIHLGTAGCKAEALVDFLTANSCDTLYLVGDIVDGWALKRRWRWPEAHSRVVREILRKADSGTRVIFVPGNHDEFLRDFCGREFAGVALLRETIHVGADGKRFLVLHGDAFDGVIAYARWLSLLGDRAYTLALHANDVLAAVRKRMNLPYWSLSAWLKHKVKDAAKYIGRFEEAVAREARRQGVEGVICGHIHHAEIRTIDGILYCNDGDWVESCTALVEDARGSLEILRWRIAPSSPGRARRPKSAGGPMGAGIAGDPAEDRALIPA